VRTVPATGRLVVNAQDHALKQVLGQGCWSEREFFDADDQWQARPLSEDCRVFDVLYEGQVLGQVGWQLIGQHNMHNALAAIAAARHAGVAPVDAITALAGFKNAKRRLEVRYDSDGITVYDDFAHHPTEIRATLSALRNAVGHSRIVAVFEPRSNTMRMGVHQSELGNALSAADQVEMFRPNGLDWELDKVATGQNGKITISDDIDFMVNRLATTIQKGDHVVIMSNGGFGGLHQKLISKLKAEHVTASAN
jgi:UDP-N-acetylmuramate: L-alanyl-gamma-D-glutamyl-meso-diaminopimelate ligase